jgi:uncharacterized protein YjiS (DUF1127 family)
MTMVTERLPHCPGTARKTGRNWLRSAFVGLWGRKIGQPTRLEPERLSQYLLKDIGLRSDDAITMVE